MSYGPLPYGVLASAFDPSDPAYQGMQLPIPALSPQFQEGQVVPGERQMLAVGPEELRARGPIMSNAIPGDQNVSAPQYSYSGFQGGGFATVPSPAVQEAMPQAPAPAPSYTPQTPPDSLPQVPRQYASADGYADYPQTTGSTGQAAPSSPFGGIEDFGRRLQAAGSFLMGNPAAAADFTHGRDKRDQTAVENARNERNDALTRQAKADQAMRQNAPNVEIGKSANGKFRTITRTNPLTGEVSVERQAIPADEQAVEERKYPKATASTDKMLNEDEDKLVKNMSLLKDAEDIRSWFREGQVDLSLIGKTTAELQTLANSGDQRAANAMRVQTFIAGVKNARLRNELGVQTNDDAARIGKEILSGSSGLNNKQVYEWVGRYMEQVDTDTKYRTGRAVNAVKRYGPDFDPESYRAQTFEGYAATARQSRERDAEAERARPYTGATAPARVTSPLEERLRNRFGAPGVR